LDAILAEHVWEHLTKEEALIAALTCYRYIKNGGYLRVAVPDGPHPNPQTLNGRPRRRLNTVFGVSRCWVLSGKI